MVWDEMDDEVWRARMMLELLLQIKREVMISLMHGSIYALDRTWFYYQIK